MGLEELLLQIVRETGPYALGALFFAALIEYVFPPFPGDSIVLLGAFYSVHGELALPAVFAAVTAGSVLGSYVDYLVGRRIAKRAGARAEDSRPRRFSFSSPAQLRKVEAAYRRHGDLYILLNRFLPGVRGVFFIAAGLAGAPVRRVLLLGALSASLWNLVLLGAGYAVGENLSDLVRVFHTYSVAVWIALGVAATALFVRALVRRPRA